MFAKRWGTAEWLSWALIKLMAVFTAASDASTPGFSEVMCKPQVTSSPLDDSGASVTVPLNPNGGLLENQSGGRLQPLNLFSSSQVLWRGWLWPCGPFPECPSSKANWWEGSNLWPMVQTSIHPSRQPLKCVLRHSIAYPIQRGIKEEEKPSSSVHNCFQRQCGAAWVQILTPGLL